MTTATTTVRSQPQTGRSRVAILASVRLTVLLLVLIAATVLLGAWCPQEPQVGAQKVIEHFGEAVALPLMKLGITDIFHTPWFLLLIALLTMNMVACSAQRVFPKVRAVRQPMPLLGADAISRLPFNRQVACPTGVEATLGALSAALAARRYRVRVEGQSLTAEFGKFGRLAPTITHIGLLTLLAGVTITSWTGFNGFQPVPVGGELNFETSEHSRLWVGRLPSWRIRVDGTRREDHPSGEPKQWYSDLTVLDRDGKEIKRQQISVNNPLSFNGVDVYQSSWDLDSVMVSFNGHRKRLSLREMGRVHAAFLPLDADTVLVFSIRDQSSPLRVFGKTKAWPEPRLLTEIPQGKAARMGAVSVGYLGAVPVTGLQYKCDPGLPVTYVAFAFIISGVLLAAVPHRQVWACASEATHAGLAVNLPSSGCILSAGGRSPKARTAFEKGMDRVLRSLGVETEAGLRV